MEWRHDVETKDLQKTSAAEIAEALVIQERELEMEGYIRGAELKAMQERRVLNSLLDSVVDSVISIDPRGTITRFKYVKVIFLRDTFQALPLKSSLVGLRRMFLRTT